MKILILFFILYLHYCISQNPKNTKKSVNQFVKKVRSGIIQYNNAGKYYKPVIKTIEKKKRNSKQDYTLFPKPFQDRANHQYVPDSPYFPVGEPKQQESRIRVKKVLPEYSLPVRYKRSADGKDKTSKGAASSSSKTQNKPKKKSPVPKSAIGTKKINVPKNKRGEAGKRKVVRESRTKTAAKNKKIRNLPSQKLRVAQKGRINQKLSRPRLTRTKTLKSQKKLSKSNLADRKTRAGRPQRGAQRQKNEKRLPQVLVHRNTSKLRDARNPKGHSARRLIAARDALIEEYPYTISIQKDGNHWCSGAILNPTLIITTANCLWRSNSISRLRVRAGSRHTDRGGQVAKIQEVMKHPGWKLRKNPDNDVALALLDRKIRFSHGVHAVDLPNRVMMPPFDDAWITSWGAERRDGIFDTKSVNLQVYHARLMDRDKCNNITQRFSVSVTENFICLSQSGTRAPCTRDTGAPAVSDGVLWGLASWGIRKLCGTERFPAMFSYMASHTNMNFIVNATHYLMKEQRIYPFLDRYPSRNIPITTPTPMTMPYKR